MAGLAIPKNKTKPSRVAVIVEASRPWCAKAFFAVVDQGLISGSNFAMGILLARWLGPKQYGAYALAFATFVLLSLVYQSLLLEPMSVFGPSTYRNRLRGYTGTLILLHAAIASATFAVMTIAAVAMGHFPQFGELPSALIGAAVAAPCVLLFWLARRVFYLRLASSQAAVGAVLYSVLLFSVLAMMRSRRMMSALMAFVIMAIAALATSGYLLLRFRPKLAPGAADPTLRQVIRENWNYGKWALASAIFMWVPWNVFYSLVASFSGMARSGELRALLNFALPMAQTYAAFSLLFLPHAATLNDDAGWSAVRRASLRITLLFVAGGLAYWTLVCLFQKPLLRLLYAGQYSDIGHFLPMIGVASILWGAAQGPALALRASRAPSSVFRIYLVAAVVAIAVGIPATLRYGLNGAVVAILIASSVGWVAGLVRIAKRPVSATELRQAA
jgi:O-antigen/teichoic acid export membrane protein